ncbi:MAG: EAL domain-containing protein [Betaproteobacteria bacterium]|nr:EAL domain-containing protein [Betaproteobacteria bacterium]
MRPRHARRASTLHAASIQSRARHNPGTDCQRSEWGFAWEANDARYLSGFLEIFLKGEFGTGAWFIVASQPEEYTFAPVHSVTQLVVTVVVLSLLVAALLGLIQVRRTLGPLQELSAATERIAARDFDTRVSEIQDNEFGALARAFNSMSARLGRQFQTLEAHGKIDAVLLSTVDMSQVAAIVIRRIAQLARADKYLLLLSDGTRAGTYRTYTTGSRDVLDGRSIVLPDTDARQLLAARDGTRAAGGGQFQIAALADIGSDYVFALPIALDAELAGAIVLGCDHDCWPDDDVISHLKELADRMAVALATARRDQELHRRAHFDALTQLPNRLLGLEELARAVAAAERHKRSLAVLFVDLDGFSTVNDTLGHYVGDQLLVQTAERLRRCVRKCDIVSRLGGDEFAVVTPEIREPDDAARVAMHVIEALTQPFYIGRDRAFVSVSVGIASFPGDGTNGEDLLRYADLAMYRAKRKGRGQIVFFEASMNADAQRRHLLERELSEALEQGQFELHYQPQLDLESDRITGAEALIRWNHPVRGIVMPDEFIGFAELSPLIEQIGSWVLQATCAQLMAWRASGLPIGHVSVNVSPRQFRNPGFAQVVAGTLSELAMPASMLRLEITESAVINNEGTVETNLASLADLGTPLELDDFGTGYSSLAYLQRLPIATVKLDRALIQNIETNQNDLAVVRAAVDMVHALGKTVVAEGVETAAQVEVLCRVKCDAIQGYYLSRPVPEAAFVQLVRDRAAEVSAAT